MTASSVFFGFFRNFFSVSDIFTISKNIFGKIFKQPESLRSLADSEIELEKIGENLPIEGDKMLVLDGIYLRDFAKMLRDDHFGKNCYTFSIENTNMLCRVDPAWDPKRPGKM